MNEVYLLNLIWAVRLYIGINASERLFMSLVPIYITLTSSSSFPVWMMPLPVQSSVLTVSYGRVHVGEVIMAIPSYTVLELCLLLSAIIINTLVHAVHVAFL